MGKKKDLSRSEKVKIGKLLEEKKTTLEISEVLQRDHRTIKNAVLDITKQRVRVKGKGFKNISDRKMRQLKTILRKKPLASSSEIFQKAGLTYVKKDTRCRILQHLGQIRRKATSAPPLKTKRLAWAEVSGPHENRLQ